MDDAFRHVLSESPTMIAPETTWNGLVTVQEMATGLRVSVAQAYRKVKDLGIAVRVGKRTLRVPLGKIAEALGEEAARAIQMEAKRRSPGSTPSSARSSKLLGTASSPGTSSASG